jgi:hypothetical protein
VQSSRIPLALAVGSPGGTLHPFAGNAWRPTKLENAQLASKESPIFSQWRSAATLAVVLPLVYQSNPFHYCHSTGEVCRGRLVRRGKLSPPVGAFAFLHSNNNVPQLLALACRVLPCLRAYFHFNWIVSSSVSMDVGDVVGAHHQRIRESSAAAVVLL